MGMRCVTRLLYTEFNITRITALALQRSRDSVQRR